MTKILIVSTSLNPESNSRKLCKLLAELLKDGASVRYVELSDYKLPICDGDSCYADPQVKELAEYIREANCVLVGVPIYNFDVSAAAKNLVELTGKAWMNKLVGFVCAAGGKSSYMSVMSFANSLMLDFRCVVIPRFVYADGSSFSETSVTDEAVVKRTKELADTACRLAAALEASQVTA